MKKIFIAMLMLAASAASANDTFLSPASLTPNSTIVVVQTPQTCEIIGNAFICH